MVVYIRDEPLSDGYVAQLKCKVSILIRDTHCKTFQKCKAEKTVHVAVDRDDYRRIFCFQACHKSYASLIVLAYSDASVASLLVWVINQERRVRARQMEQRETYRIEAEKQDVIWYSQKEINEVNGGNAGDVHVNKVKWYRRAGK